MSRIQRSKLRKRGHKVDPQREYPIHYDDNWIGSLIPDLIVDELVIVDCKVVSQFTETHYAKMIGYLSITDLKLALLLNFKYAELKWKRIVR